MLSRSLIFLIIFGTYHSSEGYRHSYAGLSSFEQAIVEHLQEVQTNVGNSVEDYHGTGVVFIAEADSSGKNPERNFSENEVVNPFQSEDKVNQVKS